jgi:ATP-binding cassette subfamily B (MDR/TAP) protein 1
MEKDGGIAVDGDKLSLARTTTTRAPSMRAGEDEEDQDYTTWELVKFSWEMNQSEHSILILGFVLCFIAGTIPAIQAIFLGNAITALVAPELTTGHHPISFWCWMFFMLAFVCWASNFGQGLTLAKASAQLVARIRERAFSSILRQDIEFFDGDKVTSGALASFLSTEANRLAGISGATLGSIISAVSSVVAAIAIACSFGWKLALVCTATIPLVLATGYFRFYVSI